MNRCVAAGDRAGKGRGVIVHASEKLLANLPVLVCGCVMAFLLAC
jgi:hypothetical protein